MVRALPAALLWANAHSPCLLGAVLGAAQQLLSVLLSLLARPLCHCRQWDLLSLALLGVLLLGATAVQLQACWPAGVLALLCFTPYFVDPQQ